MIDRAARDRMAQQLRRLACGRINTDTIKREMPATADRAVRAIANEILLFAPRDRSNAEARQRHRKRIARAVVFLYSDEPYVAKDRSWMGLAILTGGFLGLVAMLIWRFGGDRLPESAVNVLKMLVYAGFGLAFGVIFLGCLIILSIYVIEAIRPPRRAAGEDVWPFADAEQFARARLTPRLLAGRRV